MRKVDLARRQQKQHAKEYVEYARATTEELFKAFRTSLSGLTHHEAEHHREKYGKNELARSKKHSILFQFLIRFVNPLVIVLLVIACFSFLFGDKISSALVTAMAFISVFLSFMQEYKAGKEAEKLSEMVRATSTVYRDGVSREIKMRDIVPGDIVDLFAGDMIPADLRIISSKDLFVNQSTLTGESFPVEKFSAPISSTAKERTSELTNIAFMGSSVVSGTALGLVIRTGIHTQFGEISQRLASISVETSFDRGVRQLTWLMLRVMFFMVIVIFAINAFLRGNMMEALMFSLAVAVGLTPEMLPMIVTLNLSKGAIAMARENVIVKKLPSIQNFGAMDVLCTDKTGTLTLDKVVLERYCDVRGRQDEVVLRYAYINSFFQTGLKGLLDRTILDHKKIQLKHIKKVDEIPFDFQRKFMSVIVEMNDKHRIIAKGAPEEILKCCTHYKLHNKILPIAPEDIDFLRREHDRLSNEGFRVLAVAYKDTELTQSVYSKNDEKELILRGYIAFLDPPKPSAKETIESLHKLGIDVKVLTGDNELVTKKICSEVGLDVKGLVTGDQMRDMTSEQLSNIVRTTTIFCRLSPVQKEEIIHALHRNHHIVGYLGDGINDAPALKAADVGISVDSAVDIAKESADLILLHKSLTVLRDGVVEGRKIFRNIIKYVQMGTSSNFGNMLSMTGASLFLPFLPMLPIQVLLNNFLYDMSQLAIPSDNVDAEYLATPQKWNMKYIQRFMLIIGPVSSLFDFLTFGILLLFHVSVVGFHTGWFVESFVSQTLVIHIIRTRKIPFIQSKPSVLLFMTSLIFITVALFIPFSPLAGIFHFEHLPPLLLLSLAGLITVYLFIVQLIKRWFVHHFS